MIENLALRQQLAVLQRESPRPNLRASDRVFWLALRRWWPRWKEALAMVKPATVIRWHREGFRLYWRWKSRRCAGRPATMADIRVLVRRMAAENPSWGAPRIHGEIQKLGLLVSERTVSRFVARRPVDPEAHQRWQTFLSNQREVIAAIDFFEASPYDQATCYLILDRDAKYGDEVLIAIRHMGIEPQQITARSPWQNGVAERFVSTARRDPLDHVIVLNERHLQRLLAGLASYYLNNRTHLSLEKDAPAMRAVEAKPHPAAEVIALPRLGGLHHRYSGRLAA